MQLSNRTAKEHLQHCTGRARARADIHCPPVLEIQTVGGMVLQPCTAPGGGRVATDTASSILSILFIREATPFGHTHAPLKWSGVVVAGGAGGEG